MTFLLRFNLFVLKMNYSNYGKKLSPFGAPGALRRGSISNFLSMFGNNCFESAERPDETWNNLKNNSSRVLEYNNEE